MGFYGNIVTADQLRKDVWFSHKQFKLVKAKRRMGKTFSGDCWSFGNSIKQKCVVWVVTPISKMFETHLHNIKVIAEKCNLNSIKSINRRCCLEITFEPYNSKLYMITAKDLFGTFPKGREVPDYIFIDDAECYSNKELRQIHYKLKEELSVRNGNPTVLIAYTPVRKMDRLQALWKVANYKDNWDRFETFKGDVNERKKSIWS